MTGLLLRDEISRKEALGFSLAKGTGCHVGAG